MKREAPVVLQLAPGDVDSLEFLHSQVAGKVPEEPEAPVGDAGAADNPRRILLSLGSFQAQAKCRKFAQASAASGSTASELGGSH